MYMSPSTRRAWIEILMLNARARFLTVALHPEGVDRNHDPPPPASLCSASPSTRRAWIEIFSTFAVAASAASPSTRRAWIEITECINSCLTVLVALHPEGVDRNSYILDYLLKRDGQSPSTRKAWIEITY